MGENSLLFFPGSCFKAHDHVLWSSLSPLNKELAGSSSDSANLLSTGAIFHAVVSSRVGQAKTVLTFWRRDGPQLLSSFWVLICFKTNPNFKEDKSTSSWHNILQDYFGARQKLLFCILPALSVHLLFLLYPKPLCSLPPHFLFYRPKWP